MKKNLENIRTSDYMVPVLKFEHIQVEHRVESVFLIIHDNWLVIDAVIDDSW